MIMSFSFTIRPLWWYTADLTTLWWYTSSRSMRGGRIRSVRCKILNWCSEQHIRRQRGKHAAPSATHRVYEATAIHHGLVRRAGLQSRLSGHQIWTDTAKETLQGGRELVSPKKPTRAGTPGSRPPSVVPWQRREDEPTSARCNGQLSRFLSPSLYIASLCRACLPL